METKNNSIVEVKKKHNIPRFFIEKLRIFFVLLVINIAGIAYFLNQRFDTQTISMQNRPIGANVSVTGSKVSVRLKAVETKVDAIPMKNAIALGLPIDITPDGPLPAPVTLKFKLKERVEKHEFVVVATREKGKSEWTYEVPEISEDGIYASLEVTHNSIKWILKSIWDLPMEFGKEFINGATGEFFKKAEKTECDQEDEARKDGYKIESSSHDTLSWCFGMKDGKRILKVTNRKRYPLDIKHPRLEVIHPGDSFIGLGQIARLGSGEFTVLFPHDEAIYGVNLENGQNAYIQSDFYVNSGVAIYFDALERSLLALNTMIINSNMGKELKKEEWHKLMTVILENKDCTNTFAKRDWEDFAQKCLSSGIMEDALAEDKNLLLPFKMMDKVLTPSSTAFDIADMLGGMITANIDSIKRTSYDYILITRNMNESQKVATSSAKPSDSPSGNWGSMPCATPTPGGSSFQEQGYWMRCGASFFNMN